MSSEQKIVAALRNSQTNVRYADLFKVCTHYFGKPRQERTSHAKFETPWGGEPYVNIQNKNGATALDVTYSNGSDLRYRAIYAQIAALLKARGATTNKWTGPRF